MVSVIDAAKKSQVCIKRPDRLYNIQYVFMVSDKFTIQTSCSLVLRHVFYSLCIKSERLKLNITKCGQFTFLLDQM